MFGPRRVEKNTSSEFLYDQFESRQVQTCYPGAATWVPPSL